MKYSRNGPKKIFSDFLWPFIYQLTHPFHLLFLYLSKNRSCPIYQSSPISHKLEFYTDLHFPGTDLSFSEGYLLVVSVYAVTIEKIFSNPRPA